MSSTVCTIAYCCGNLLRVVCTKSVNPICKVNLAGEPAAIVSIKGRAFLHLREDLRRIGEKLAEGLALSVRNPYRTSLWLALLTASYFPAGEETLVPKR